MKIADIYAKKKNVLSFEIFPPKQAEELNNIDETLDILSDLHPDYISITFGAGGSSNNNKTIDIARHIKEKYGIEPLVHLTCMCYTREEIDAFAKEIQAAGIENILALRGDYNPRIPMRDDFAHASDLIAYLKARYDFCIAGACYPEDHPDSQNHVSEMHNLKKKADAGADFMISQLFFNNHHFYKMMDDCAIAGINVPLTPGIMPVINGAQIHRMVNTCGASLPARFERIIQRYQDKPEALYDAGMAYALSQIIDLLANETDGIHLYTMNNPKVARSICEGIKNII